MNIFEDPSLKLELIGKLRTRTASEVKTSPLSIGFETLDRELFNPDKCYDLLAESGAKYARCQTGWCRCEKEKGIYDFAWLDSVVDNLIKRGVEPWFNVGYGNTLYMSGVPHESAVGYSPTCYGDECLNAWKNYVAAMVKHFSGRVNKWEIWNEPNLDCFWRPSTATGSNYAGLVAETSKVIRHLSPTDTVSACVTGVDCSFLHEALKAGMGDHIDVITIHPYNPVPERGYFSNVAALRNILKKYAPHVRLWQGECGYPAQTYKHHDEWMNLYNADQDSQARFVIRRIVLDSMMKMELISYFHISDLMEKAYRQAEGSVRPPVMLGLLHGDSYTPKKSYYAYKNMAAIFDSETVQEDLYISLSDFYDLRQVGAIPLLAPVTGGFVRRDYPLYTYYFPEDLQRGWRGMKNLTVKIIDQTEKRIEKPVMIDCLSGNVYRCSDFVRHDSTAFMQHGYVDVNGLPLTDYPLIITDASAIDINPLK